MNIKEKTKTYAGPDAAVSMKKDPRFGGLTGDAKQDLEQLKQDILTSDASKSDFRVPGVKSFKFKPETLRRI